MDAPLKGRFDSAQVAADDSRQTLFTGTLNIYYDAVIAALRDVESLIILGPGEAKGELKRRLVKNEARGANCCGRDDGEDDRSADCSEGQGAFSQPPGRPKLLNSAAQTLAFATKLVPAPRGKELGIRQLHILSRSAGSSAPAPCVALLVHTPRKHGGPPGFDAKQVPWSFRIDP